MKDLGITFPNALSEEEVELKKVYEKLRALRKISSTLMRANVSATNTESNKTERKITRRSIQQAEVATEEVKRKVMCGAIHLAKPNEKNTFKRLKVERRRDPPKKIKLDEQQADAADDGFDTFVSSFDTYDTKKLCPGTSDQVVSETKENKGPTLYIRGYDLLADPLQKAFEKFGSVAYINVDEKQRFAFLTLGNAEEAEKAIDEMDGNMVNGITLRVSFARRQNQYGPPKQNFSSNTANEFSSFSGDTMLDPFSTYTPGDNDGFDTYSSGGTGVGSSDFDTYQQAAAKRNDSNTDDFNTYGKSADDGFDTYGKTTTDDGFDTYGKVKDDGFDTYGKAKDDGFDTYGKAKDDGFDTYGKAKDDGFDTYSSAKDDGFNTYQSGDAGGGDGFDTYQSSNFDSREAPKAENASGKGGFRANDSDGTRGPALFIRGRDLDADRLRGHFEKFGTITRLRVEEHQKTAFLTFSTVESAESAIKELDDKKVDGKFLHVSFARKQPQQGGDRKDRFSNPKWKRKQENESAEFSKSGDGGGFDMYQPSSGTDTSKDNFTRSDKPRNQGTRGATICIQGKDLETDHLRSALISFGLINKIRVDDNQRIAFLTYSDVAEADQAVEQATNLSNDSGPIRISYARNQRSVPTDSDKQGEYRPFNKDRNKGQQDSERGFKRTNPEPGPTVYVRCDVLSEDSLRGEFERFGSITRLHVDEMKRVAFITFDSTEIAENAIKEMDRKLLNGSTLRASFARRQGSSGGGGPSKVPAAITLRNFADDECNKGDGDWQNTGNAKEGVVVEESVSSEVPQNVKRVSAVQIEWSKATRSKAEEDDVTTEERQNEARKLVMYEDDDPFA